MLVSPPHWTFSLGTGTYPEGRVKACARTILNALPSGILRTALEAVLPEKCSCQLSEQRFGGAGSVMRQSRDRRWPGEVLSDEGVRPVRQS